MPNTLSGMFGALPAGIQGYEAARQGNQQADMNELAQASGAMGLLAKIRAEQEQQMLKQQLQGANTPQEAINRLIATGRPEAIALAAKLKGLLPTPDKGQAIGSGGLRLADGTIVPPAARPQSPQQFAPPEILKLQDALAKAQPGTPAHAAISARIKMLTERAPGVTVNMPPTSDVVVDDATGEVGRFRVGKDGKREFIPFRIGDKRLRPPESPSDKKAREGAVEDEATIESVRGRVAELAGLVQKNPTAVGLAGLARRGVETVSGVSESLGGPAMSTPAIDFQNQQALLLADVRKMVEKDSNLSKDERERLYQTLGGGTFQTPTSAITAMNNVLSYVENKKKAKSIGGLKIETAVRNTGSPYEPDKYTYRINNGVVQRKAK